MKSMSLQERHNYILKKFIISDKSFEGKKNSYDIDIIKEHHRFLWEDNELSDGENSWEMCMARRYYNKLFKVIKYIQNKTFGKLYDFLMFEGILHSRFNSSQGK
uniref:Protein FRA10AC1 n=1 Tax=Bactrocera latifrons TaxID=174628 RepID=A0A0K8UFJ2_BACLA